MTATTPTAITLFMGLRVYRRQAIEFWVASAHRNEQLSMAYWAKTIEEINDAEQWLTTLNY